jgi:uncharacterized protein YdcH (DUF465 family)
MLSRIKATDPDFDDLCVKHADLTTEIRKLNPDTDVGDAQRNEQLRRQRADVEDVMLAIMQANTRV